MTAARRVLLALALLAAPAAAQQGVWLSGDEPDLPAFELLVLRGEVRDPTPQVRPLRRGAVLAALATARCRNATCERNVARLKTAWGDPATHRITADAFAGVQGATAARRDPLYAEGRGKEAEAYAAAGVGAEHGALAATLRLEYDPRLERDPDASRSGSEALRVREGWIGAASRHAAITVGVLPRRWGPEGVPGLARSDGALPRPELAVELGGAFFRFSAVVTPLDDSVAVGGGPARRWLALHRLDVGDDRWHLALWESAVAQGERGGPGILLDGLFGVLAFDDQFGREARRNSIIGIDAGAWVTGTLRAEAQVAIDDWRLRSENVGAGEYPRPDRYAWTATLGGPVGPGAWRATWSRISNLAYRTDDPLENFLVDGVGLGPLVPDRDLLRLEAFLPVHDLAILRPGLTLLRQGEGRIQTPFPDTPATLGAAPGFLAGTVRRTLRLSLGVDGRLGPARLRADAGLNFDRNADHVAGASRNAFVGRFLLGFGTGRRWSPS